MMLGEGTLAISHDGGVTWQERHCRRFAINFDTNDKPVAVYMPPRIGMAMSLKMAGDWRKKIAEFFPQPVELPSVAYEAPKKKKAQWKQSPLSRFSR